MKGREGVREEGKRGRELSSGEELLTKEWRGRKENSEKRKRKKEIE